MDFVPIPLNAPLRRDVDEASLSEQGVFSRINLYLDGVGANVSRPGSGSFATSGVSAAAHGLYWWEQKQRLIAVIGGRFFNVARYSGIATELTGATFSDVTTRVSFATNGEYLVMANGGSIVYWNGVTATVAVVPGAPSDVIGLTCLDNYILAARSGTAVDGGGTTRTNIVEFSDATAGLTSPLVWNGDFFSAETKPGSIVGVWSNWREVFVACAKSGEVWYDDGSTPFSRIEGAFTERGVIAPASVVQADSVWYFLDDRKRFVRINGRTPEEISKPISPVLQDMLEVSDCIGDVVNIDGESFILWTFPTEDVSWCYDYANNLWWEWLDYDETTGNYGRSQINCHVYVPEWNVHIVGTSAANGVLLELNATTHDDYGSTVIRPFLRTGHLDFGSPLNKFIREVRVRVKRAQGSATGAGTEPMLGFRFRVDGGPTWSTARQISLGRVGESMFIARTFNLGRGRTWQFEFWSSENCEINIVSAQAALKVGAN